MKKFTWASYTALTISLYPFLYFQISKQYEQHHMATGDPSLPYEPIWIVLYFLSPLLSMAISIVGLILEEKEIESPWMFRISIIISVVAIFYHATQYGYSFIWTPSPGTP
ncbi:hypothetical protein V7024_15420 [Bacillus sp. JJ864]|uniref:hypothetical protein n=1 Tax=Bacillus sp. JJ864 TaxID=3122975 RepID=UPI002FFE5C56